MIDKGVRRDLTGIVFGSYKVIKLTGKKGNKYYWLCKCSCGREIDMNTSAINSGTRDRCKKCTYKKRREDLTGRKYGKWKVLQFVGKNKKQYTCWKCICECGFVGTISTGKLKSGNTTKCKGCRSEEFIYHSVDNWYNKNKRNAKSRNWNFDITKEYAINLYIKQDGKCAISGLIIDFADNSIEEQKGRTTASLDRIDSKIGYQDGNVQWVHKDINLMKQKFKQDYFINLCRTIVEYNK